MKIWFVGISLSLHALVFAGLLFVKTRAPQVEAIDIELKTVEPQIDVQTASKHRRVSRPDVAPASPRARASAHPSSRVSAHFRLGDFSPQRWQPEAAEVAAQKYGLSTGWFVPETYDSQPLHDFDGLDVARVRFLTSFWSEIDKSIWQSPFLSEYGHVGTVYLRFEVTPTGDIVRGSLHARAEDDILKVVAARAVRKALRNESHELVLPTENVVMNARFLWADYDSCNHVKGIHQYFLSFCKYGENKKKSFSKTEKAATYLGALKYGFGAADEIKEYNREEHRRKTQFDPFEDLRRDPDYNLGS